jgi:hypothetical protein
MTVEPANNQHTVERETVTHPSSFISEGLNIGLSPGAPFDATSVEVVGIAVEVEVVRGLGGSGI